MSLSGAEIQAIEGAHTSGIYPKRPLAIVRGKGALVWDSEGREYLDCVAGHGSANLGHCHPAVVAALQEQSARLLLCPESLYNDQRARFLQRLTELAPRDLGRAFLCNSGTEANEAALKFARLATGRAGVVAAKRGFHGRTLGALSATWEKKYRQAFEPLLPGFSHVTYDDLEAMSAAVTEETGCVILEVVQGEGGVRVASADYLRGVQELCRRRGALLLVDEVQTGVGRTGSLFACEQFGLEPDLLTLAKSLGGGMPLGAVLIGSRVGDLPRLCHGSTFGGNPLACAAGLATLEVVVEEGLAARAAELGEYFMGRLRELGAAQIREVRGLGLLVGVELRTRVTPTLKALMERGILALPAGSTVLRFLPPLVIEREQLDRVVDALRDVLG